MRQRFYRVGQLFACATLLAGCGGSPFDQMLAAADLEHGARGIDAASDPDDLAASDGDSATADLATDDDLALPDLATPPDLSVPAELPDLAAPPDLTPSPDLIDPKNPFGIALTDVTMIALGGKLYGGRSKNNLWGAGSGCGIGDLDGDGKLDLVFARNDDPASDRPGGPSQFLRNGGDVGGFGFSHFVADADFTALMRGVRAHGVALGDYDRDGDLDLFIACEGRDFLLRNDGAGHFTDVTNLAGVGGRNDDLSLTAVWADLNHDGLLDLYVANFNEMPGMASDSARNRLYINLGDGTFADVSAASGTDNVGASHAATIFDFDGRGDLGIVVSNDQFSADGMGGAPGAIPDAWYVLSSVGRDGTPVFTDEARPRGIVYPRSGMGIAVADVDGDLTPDLWTSDIGKKELYLNPMPGGMLTESASQFNLQLHEDSSGLNLITWGARFLDLDRDGLLELWVNDGFFYDPLGCEAYHQVPSYLRQPAKSQPYDLITGSVGLAWPVPKCPGGVGNPDTLASRAVVYGDLDGDGDDDFVITPYATPFFVYRNDTPRTHHALRVRLGGTVSSPDPIGASVLVTRLSGARAVVFYYGGGEVYSQSDRTLTVGVGDDAAVSRVDVRWPSGIFQRVDGLPGFALDQAFTVVEPAWLTVEPRVVAPGDPPAKLVYRPVDESGAPLGKAGAGRVVTAMRSDGVAITVVDAGDGSYTADLGHPGATRRVVIILTVDGLALRPRPMINFK